MSHGSLQACVSGPRLKVIIATVAKPLPDPPGRLIPRRGGGSGCRRQWSSTACAHPPDRDNAGGDKAEAATKRQEMGHLLISCGCCPDQFRTATFDEPPYDITHRPLTLACHKTHWPGHIGGT
jgi:hypothetical protein